MVQYADLNFTVCMYHNINNQQVLKCKFYANYIEIYKYVK